MTEAASTEAVVAVDRSQVPAVRALAAEHGVTVEEVSQRGIDPVTATVVVLMGSVTAVATVSHLVEQWRGGQVIDLRPGTSRELYRTRDVVYGIVVIIARDGAVRVEVKEPAGMFGKVISTLPSLLSSGADSDQVTKTVTDTFGPEVTVEALPQAEQGDGG